MMRISRLSCVASLVAIVASGLSDNGHATVLKIATTSRDGSVWMQSLRQAATEITEHTAGRVMLKFYAGGVMGDDTAVMRKIDAGQLQGAVMTVGGLAPTYSDIQLYSLPMLFRSLPEVDHVRERMDPLLVAGLETHGFVSFGFAEVGFAYAMSQAPVRSLSDMQAQKIWVPEGDGGAVRALEAFDLTPVPLRIADVLGGLQSGSINSVVAPPAAAIALQWHTRLKHVLDLPLLYVYGTLAISADEFGKLSAEDQAFVREVMSKLVRDVNDRNRKDHERSVEVLRNQGLTWNIPQPAEVVEWQSHADKASDTMAESGIVSEPLYEALMRNLQDFRKSVD